MGMTFHYSGRIRKAASLQDMIDEVQDIARINGWEHHSYNRVLPGVDIGSEVFNDQMYGISFMPTGSEPVWLTFLSNGRLSTPDLLQLYGKPENSADRKNLYLVSTKTQFAGISTHKTIIDLLKYIDKKYLADFKVYDEGQYWETGDEKILEEIAKRFSTALDIFGDAVEKNERLPNESYEDFFRRILKGKTK